MAASKSPRLRLLHMRDEIESLSKELAGLSFDAKLWASPDYRTRSPDHFRSRTRLARGFAGTLSRSTVGRDHRDRQSAAA